VNFSSNFSRPSSDGLLHVADYYCDFSFGSCRVSFFAVAPLPQVDFPTSAWERFARSESETMASAVCYALERQFSRIAGVTKILLERLGSTSVTLQFDLNRDITPPRAMFKPRSTPLAASFPPTFQASPRIAR